ncbi:MAG: Ger(x)C family spore germination protein [Clostridiaceae bacterium]
MKKIILVLLIIPFILTACWDKVEIDRKIFISTIGIDAGEDIEKAKEMKKLKGNEPFQVNSIKKYNITYAFPNISKLGPQNTQGAELQYINTDAYSMESGIVNSLSKTSRTSYFGHTKLLLLSNEILKDKENFQEIIDYLERQHIMNRMMYVIVCTGKAQDYIKFVPGMEQNVEAYITGLMENSKQNATILPVTLNELIILLRQNGNAILPNINIDKVKNEIYLTGVDFIKDYELVGSMNPIEVTDLELMRGEQQAGFKTVYMNGFPVDLQIYGTKRKIKVQEKDNKIIVDIKLGIEGEVKDFYIGGKAIDDALIKKAEEDFNKSLSAEFENVIKISQSEFNVDAFKIRDHIEKFNPKIYEKVKNNWDEAFTNMTVNVSVKTSIRRIGAIK